MKNPFKVLVVVAGLLAGLVALAQSSKNVPLKFTQVDLTDGRTLKNVVIRSYDVKSEKLLLVADGKAMTVPVALFPAPFNERLKAAPRSGESVSTITVSSPRPIASAADQYYMTTPVPAPLPRVRPEDAQKVTKRQFDEEARSQAPRVVTVTPQPAPHAPLPAVATLAQHAAAARARATTYFRYEFQIGSNSVSVTALDFELGTPKPVPGWEGRYESQGKAFIEYFDSKGRSFQRTTSTFEVITEQKPGEDLSVVDFRRKN